MNWANPGPSTRCELAFYILDEIRSDYKFCGAPKGTCPAYKKFKNSNHYNVCPYYKSGRDKLALKIAEMMPLPKGEVHAPKNSEEN